MEHFYEFLRIFFALNLGFVFANLYQDFSAHIYYNRYTYKSFVLFRKYTCICMYKTEKTCAAMDPSFFSCCPECQGEMLLCCVFSPFFLTTRYVNPCRISSTKGIVLREIPARERGFFVGIFVRFYVRNCYQFLWYKYLYNINLYQIHDGLFII